MSNRKNSRKNTTVTLTKAEKAAKLVADRAAKKAAKELAAAQHEAETSDIIVTGTEVVQPRTEKATVPAVVKTAKAKSLATSKERAVLNRLASGSASKQELWRHCKAVAAMLGAATKGESRGWGKGGMIGKGWITGTITPVGVVYDLTDEGRKVLATVNAA